MLITGKSCVKSTVVLPRLKAAVPITLLVPYGLSEPEIELDEWASISSRTLSLGFHPRLTPSERSVVFTPNWATPIATSAGPGLGFPWASRWLGSLRNSE